MATPKGYKALEGSVFARPKDHKKVNRTAGNEPITVTLVLRRSPAGQAPRGLKEFSSKKNGGKQSVSHAEFAANYGADSQEMDQAASWARSQGLEVVNSNAARRSLVVRGNVDEVNRAFAVQLQDYESPRGKYKGHEGAVNLPTDMAKIVEAVFGLENHPVQAQHFSTARRQNPNDPPGTKPVSPLEVAQLYDFPPGDGGGQTIGIYEMETSDGKAGYTTQDLQDTMQAFGGALNTPVPIDVAVDGVTNSGVSDGETGLDITIASAIAQQAKIAVYFTGGTTQNIVHALQRMIHPDQGDPVPTVISISYGWGPDDLNAGSFTDQAYAQIGQLFQDAANLSITVLVSSGDSGAFIQSPTIAQTSYPATEPWVIACGGTTIGDVNGNSYDEYVWNDTGAAGPGATGGGVSDRFAPPDYQSGIAVPKRISTKKPGRGIPDIAGNASENSGYPQFINGRSQAVGGTSAVAPLYAGLIARINANLGFAVGFIHPTIYSLRGNAFRGISAPPGPANNSFGRVKGYSASGEWNACTGLGSVNGTALENGLRAAHGVAAHSAA